MIEEIWKGIQVFCAGVMAIGSAGTIFVGLYRWFKKPDMNRDEKIKEHDDKLDNDFRDIKELKKRQEETDKAMQILMKSMLALMSHSIDGDHIEELKIARDDMQNYLIRR